MPTGPGLLPSRRYNSQNHVMTLIFNGARILDLHGSSRFPKELQENNLKMFESITKVAAKASLSRAFGLDLPSRTYFTMQNMGPSICCQVSQEDHLHLKIKHMVGRVILLGVPVDVPFGWPVGWCKNPSVSAEWLRVSQGANWTVPPCRVEWKAKKFWLKWTWRRKLQCLQLDFSTFQCLYLDFPSSCLLLLLLLLILFLCILLLIPFVRHSLHHLFLLLCASDFLRSLAVYFAQDVSSHFQVRHLAGVLPQHHSLVWRISLRKIHPCASSSVFSILQMFR